jgi:hypothetical protein
LLSTAWTSQIPRQCISADAAICGKLLRFTRMKLDCRGREREVEDIVVIKNKPKGNIPTGKSGGQGRKPSRHGNGGPHRTLKFFAARTRAEAHSRHLSIFF